jgi:hypothetical protein
VLDITRFLSSTAANRLGSFPTMTVVTRIKCSEQRSVTYQCVTSVIFTVIGLGGTNLAIWLVHKVSNLVINKTSNRSKLCCVWYWTWSLCHWRLAVNCPRQVTLKRLVVPKLKDNNTLNIAPSWFVAGCAAVQ